MSIPFCTGRPVESNLERFSSLVAIRTNAFCSLDKYIYHTYTFWRCPYLFASGWVDLERFLQLGVIRTNIFCDLYNLYILLFCKFDKYILQFGKIHFGVSIPFLHWAQSWVGREEVFAVGCMTSRWVGVGLPVTPASCNLQYLHINFSKIQFFSILTIANIYRSDCNKEYFYINFAKIQFLIFIYFMYEILTSPISISISTFPSSNISCQKEEETDWPSETSRRISPLK